MTRLDLRDLRIFAAVARCLNFTEAAAQLHMSQPPLSRAVRQLEDAIGVALFDRDTHHVALTEAGRALLPRAHRILREVHEAESLLRAFATTRRTFRIGFTTAVEPGSFDRYIEALAADPSIGDVEATYAPSPKLGALLARGRIDAAVIALPTRVVDLAVTLVGSQPMMVALPAAHRLAKRRALSLADLHPETVFWFERARQPAFFDHCQRVFEAHDFAPTFVREPADHHVLLAHIAACRGIAFLPRSFAAIRSKGVAYRPLVEGGELAVRLAFAHPASDGGPALDAAIKRARRLVGR